LAARSWTWTALALSLAATPVAAQEPPTPPAAAPAASPDQRHPFIRIYAWETRVPATATNQLRRVRPAEDIRTWIQETDPEFELVRTEPELEGEVSLLLDIGVDGRATSCRLENPRGEPRLTEHLCERLSGRVVMVPALDQSGVPTADTARISVSYKTQRGATSRLVHNTIPFPIIGMPSWPPREPGQGRVTGLPALRGGPEGPDAHSAPWAGVEMLYDRQDRLICRLIDSSGDAAFNAQACAASGVGTYDLTRGEQEYDRRVRIHFVRQDGAARALIPTRWPAEPAIEPSSLAAIRAALAEAGHTELGRLKLKLEADTDGRLVHCSIVDSSGSDGIDVAVCNLAREHARLSAARDVFGRRVAGRLYLPLTTAN
jgi:hypothetical protein